MLSQQHAGAELDPPVVLVSACLLGLRCRYDLESRENCALTSDLSRLGLLPVPVCPEQLGGLPTPRAPMVFEGEGGGEGVFSGAARLVNSDGKDCTKEMKLGALETLRLVRLLRIRRAYLKSRSPSCGWKSVSTDSDPEPVSGVTAVALERAHVEIIPVD